MNVDIVVTASPKRSLNQLCMNLHSFIRRPQCKMRKIDHGIVEVGCLSRKYNGLGTISV